MTWLPELGLDVLALATTNGLRATGLWVPALCVLSSNGLWGKCAWPGPDMSTGEGSSISSAIAPLCRCAGMRSGHVAGGDASDTELSGDSAHCVSLHTPPTAVLAMDTASTGEGQGEKVNWRELRAR